MRTMMMIELMAVLAVATGCTDATDTSASTERKSAADRAWLQDGLPLLQSACAGCHADPGTDIAFLEGTNPFEQRDSLIASGLVDLFDVYNSRLLTKGPHSGPSLSSLELSDLLTWIKAERDEL